MSLAVFTNLEVQRKRGGVRMFLLDSYLDFLITIAIVAVVVLRRPWGLGLWLGVGLAAVSFLLWVLARYQLGDSFAITAEVRGLVTHGLYRRIRHPMYVFSSLCYLGILLAVGQWWLLLLLGPIILVQYARARQEEAALASAFGEAYRRYVTQTWF